MRHGAEKNDTVPVGNDPLMKVPLHLSSPCSGAVQFCTGTNGDRWKIMTPGMCVPPRGVNQPISPVVTCPSGNQLLRNMIAQDVNLVSNSGVEKYINHSRKKTRVASLPDGTVQITFRGMIQADQSKQIRPPYQVPILPKSIISDLNLCPLTANKTSRPIEPKNGRKADPTTCQIPQSPVSQTNTVSLVAMPTTSCTNVVTRSSVPSRDSVPIHNLSHYANTGININNTTNDASPFTRGDSLCPNEINPPDNSTSISARGCTIPPNPAAHSDAVSSEAQWGHMTSQVVLLNTRASSSLVSSAACEAKSPSLEISTSDISNNSLSATSLEEDLSRDLREMCPALFSPSAMDVDNLQDSNEYFDQHSPLPGFEDCARSLTENTYTTSSQVSISTDRACCDDESSFSLGIQRDFPSTIAVMPNIQQPIYASSTFSSYRPQTTATAVQEVTNRRINGFTTPANYILSNHEQFQSACNVSMTTTSDERIVQCSETVSHDAPPPDNNLLCTIVDISPEVSSTQGGGKIIIIGAWNERESSYSCSFGDLEVPAELVQHGVLRCFCPPHPAGKIPLLVFKDNVIISNSATFEYVDADVDNDNGKADTHHWLSIDEDDLKKLLFERIDAIHGVIDPLGTVSDQIEMASLSNIEFEIALCRLCESLSRMEFSLCNVPHTIENSMTVLHLAAALGYTQLIQTLCSWTDSTNSNCIITQEADPVKRDQFGWIPLFWACAKGRFDTVCVLLQWRERTSRLKDLCGCTPLSIVKDQNHMMLFRYLEKFRDRWFSRERVRKGVSSSPPVRMLSTSSDRSPLGIQLTDVTQGEDLPWETSSSLSEGGVPCMRPTEAFGLRPYEGSGSSSRTLAKTLAQVQAIIQDTKGDPDRSNPGSPSEYVTSDEESLFDVPPFTPRSRGIVEDCRGQTVSTPLSSVSSHSPGSPSQGGTAHSPFDPSSHDTAEFCEFFYNSKEILEKDFAELTLTDQEQQELYRAASIIQKAYKAYRERRKRRDHELQAATLIQSYYRRYKQYASFKKMQKGALLIQSQFRAHREERKKTKAASIIQTYYRRYKERKDAKSNIQERNRAQQDAGRRANRFLKQTSSRLRDRSMDFGPNQI